MKNEFCLTLAIINLLSQVISIYSQKPHIIFILADDLGWNDVGWNNREMITPNLDSLASQGVIFNQSYVQSSCTPSRSALMTGMYPFRTGRQNHVLHPLMPTGIPLRFVFLPEKLKESGYATQMVGKWHLGYCNRQYTPNQRGFDSFYGFYTGALDYFSHSRSIDSPPWNTPEKEIGLDLWNNSKVLKNKYGIYSTDLFRDAAEQIIRMHDTQTPLFLYLSFQTAHSPLQVPKKYEDLYHQVTDGKRRKFCGMVTAMDEAIGSIVSRLKLRGMLENSLIIFTTDNGGQTFAGGNNWPLRGNKGTLWEGGNRVPTFIWGTPVKKAPRISNKLIHIVDWFPTILHLASAQLDGIVDGINQWSMISDDSAAMRNEIIYNIYDAKPTRAAIRIGDYKLIEGFPGNPSGWISLSNSDETHSIYCNIKNQVNENIKSSTLRLYNIKDDPLEQYNIYEKHPRLVQRLQDRIKELQSMMLPADDPPPSDLGNPSRWEGIFSPGWCEAA